MTEHPPPLTVEEPAWREKQRAVNALQRLDSARRAVMALHGGNLDHPALDHIESAMAEVDRLHAEHYGGHPMFDKPEPDWPCSSTAVSVLGMVGEPAEVRCGYLKGHDGPHRMSIEWTHE